MEGEAVDAGGQEAPAPEAAAAPGVFQEGPGYMFSDNWEGQALGSEHDPTADPLPFKNLGEMAKGYRSLRASFHQAGKVEGYPTDGNQESLAAWNKAVGLEGVDEPTYAGAATPENLPENMAVLTEFLPALMNRGVPAAQAKGIIEDFINFDQGLAERTTADYQVQLQRDDAKLRGFLGGGQQAQESIDTLKQLAASFIDIRTGNAVDPGDGQIFDNPVIVGILAQVKDALSEDQLAARMGVTLPGATETPNQEANRIMEEANSLRYNKDVPNAHPMSQRYADGDPDAMEFVNQKLRRSGV
tara:strand:+ start:1948 stop:2850 length:903 start_codon:yes stop_codon:yes gene_type:complete